MHIALNTPYYQVQAIRRGYKDAGIPTYAKASAYPIIVNFVGTTVGEVAGQGLTIDQDSVFLWTHTYHYFQNAIYDPSVGSIVANNNSGQFLDIQGSFTVDIRIERSGGRTLHDGDFAFDMFSDGFYAVVNGLPASFDDESELMGVGVGVPLGSDLNNAVSIYRSANPEPVVLPARSQITFSIRRRFASALRPFRGHCFVLSGVRLYPVGR